MADPIVDPSTALAARLSRRDALKTYAPPALAVVGVASLQTFGTSGKVKTNPPNPGGGQPGGGGGQPGGGVGSKPKK